MSSLGKYGLVTLVGILLGVILCTQFHGCGKKKNKKDIINTTHIKTITETIIDTIYVEKPVIKYTSIIPEGYEKINDSLLATRFIKNDSVINAEITVYSTKKASSLDLEYKITCPEKTITNNVQTTITDTITNTQTEYISQHLLFVGVNVGVGNKTLQQTSFDLNWKNKKDLIYNIGLIIPFTGDPIMYKVGFKYPIKFKR